MVPQIRTSVLFIVTRLVKMRGASDDHHVRNVNNETLATRCPELQQE